MNIQQWPITILLCKHYYTQRVQYSSNLRQCRETHFAVFRRARRLKYVTRLIRSLSFALVYPSKQ